MNKTVICTAALLVSLSLDMAAHEVLKPDTIRTELRSAFIEELGDTTDQVVAGCGTANWFISLSGGVNSLAAEGNRDYDNFIRRANLSLRLNAGKWVTPVWGVRVQMGFGNLSGHYWVGGQYNIYDPAADHAIMPDGMKPYVTEKNGGKWYHRKFSYLDWSLNLMTDAVRWFSNEEKPVGVVLSAGPGFAHGFASRGASASNSFTFNAGIMLNVRVHKNWDVFAEAQGTIVDESFDGRIGGSDKHNRAVEGYAGLNVGVSYKFGGRKFARYAKVHPVIYESVRYIQPSTVVEVEEPASEDVVTEFAVRFFIDKYNIEDDQKLNIDRMARYLKSHPEANLELIGFADKETAYPAYNMKLSERRVKSVRDYLTKKCGVDPSRLIINAKGDTERAYDEDYRWNRVVVMKVIDNNKKD